MSFIRLQISYLILLVTCYCNARNTFDYVIVGGGTCGLVIANRLSEDPNLSIAIIEAGGSVFDNSNVTKLGSYGLGLDTDIDWSYSSIPQAYANNQQVPYHAGKALGGTSTINGMTYIRAEKAQIDGWQELGNDGWNWSTLWPYYLKTETFQPPTCEQAADGASFVDSAHGQSGPVTVGWMDLLLSGDIESMIQKSWANLGFPHIQDASTGVLRGFNVWPLTLNRVQNIRTDAARAYYWPVANRTNLHTFDFTLARRIIWQDALNEGDPVIAAGVEIVSSSGIKETLLASREVILSAGSLISPVLLEASGIGNPSILERHDITVKVALPTVGENLQDQINTAIVDRTGLNLTGYPPYVTYATAADLFGSNLSSVETHVRQSIPSYANLIAAQSSNSTTSAIQEHLLTLQANLIFQSPISVAEILTPAASDVLETVFWGLLPFSRGSTHLAALNASGAPTATINPNFFMLEWDAILQTAIARLSRRALATAPLSGVTVSELSPGLAEVPENASDAVWVQWLKSSFTPNSHPCCTVPMMSRELGGVLDPDLLVYGTTNVRVVDASAMPYQVNGHLTATLYALAEKAADAIKGRTW